MARYCERCPGYAEGFCEGNVEDAVKCNAVAADSYYNPNLPCSSCPYPVRYSCMRTRDDFAECKRNGTPKHAAENFSCPAVEYVHEVLL